MGMKRHWGALTCHYVLLKRNVNDFSSQVLCLRDAKPACSKTHLSYGTRRQTDRLMRAVLTHYIYCKSLNQCHCQAVILI